MSGSLLLASFFPFSLSLPIFLSLNFILSLLSPHHSLSLKSPPPPPPFPSPPYPPHAIQHEEAALLLLAVLSAALAPPGR